MKRICWSIAHQTRMQKIVQTTLFQRRWKCRYLFASENVLLITPQPSSPMILTWVGPNTNFLLDLTIHRKNSLSADHSFRLVDIATLPIPELQVMTPSNPINTCTRRSMG